jgi:hypothetical protein
MIGVGRLTRRGRNPTSTVISSRWFAGPDRRRGSAAPPSAGPAKKLISYPQRMTMIGAF